MKCGEAEFPHKQFRYMTVYLLGAEEPGGVLEKGFFPLVVVGWRGSRC